MTLVKSWIGKLTNPLGHDYPIMSTVLAWVSSDDPGRL